MGRRPLLSGARVLAAIQAWLVEHGHAPSIEQLRRVLKVGSTRTVFRYLQHLEEAGAIERDDTGSLRLLRPIATSVRTRAVPLMGEVPAGPLMVAEENIEGWLRLPESLIGSSASKPFLLRVRGRSMNQARVGKDLLEDGDLVLVRQQSMANHGDIVVALIDGEATVKKLLKSEGYWILQARSTEHYKPIVVEKGFRVLGVVTKVLKNGSEITNLVEE